MARAHAAATVRAASGSTVVVVSLVPALLLTTIPSLPTLLLSTETKTG
jgi:hypothetical protein